MSGRYFTCGIDVARGPEADTFRIYCSQKKKKSFLKRTTKRVELRNSFVFLEITVLRLVRCIFISGYSRSDTPISTI